jgi:hypothetical protein
MGARGAASTARGERTVGLDEGAVLHATSTATMASRLTRISYARSQLLHRVEARA